VNKILPPEATTTSVSSTRTLPLNIQLLKRQVLAMWKLPRHLLRLEITGISGLPMNFQIEKSSSFNWNTCLNPSFQTLHYSLNLYIITVNERFKQGSEFSLKRPPWNKHAMMGAYWKFLLWLSSSYVSWHSVPFRMPGRMTWCCHQHNDLRFRIISLSMEEYQVDLLQLQLPDQYYRWHLPTAWKVPLKAGWIPKNWSLVIEQTTW